ncbi:hypothetical protein [Streptomyces sp. NPDC101776]|uniref:hypothetical protein n=1 Tax=Streptomyces sp. NPDC101776 TaxID=3366146 RepID=UPI00381D918A
MRYFKFGEGRYAQTEDLIRTLLKRADPNVRLPPKTGQKDTSLTKDRTPETCLSNQRISGYVGDPLEADKARTYRSASDIPVNSLSLDGAWPAGYQYFTSGIQAYSFTFG